MLKEKEALIFGIGSLFNLWGNQLRLSRKSPYERDSHSIRKDWSAVGKDIMKVLAHGR